MPSVTYPESLSGLAHHASLAPSRPVAMAADPSEPAAVAQAPALDEARLVARLRAGDESAFTSLVEHHHAAMLRVARHYVASEDVAAEVVQETWLALLNGIDGFEGRCTLKVWLFRVLTNRAKTRGVRERRQVPFSSLRDPDAQDCPSLPPERFQSDDQGWPGRWAIPPRAWERPEQRLSTLETREHVNRALAMLPRAQQMVIALHDIEGLSTQEVCELLDISPGNVRVLLHRGRSTVRAELESYLEGAPA